MANRKELYKEDMYKKLMPTQGMEDDEVGSYYYGDEPPLHKHHPPSVGRDVQYINIQETLVKEKLDTAISKFSCCDCERCRKEIMALALNELPPRYMVLEKGDTIPPISKQEHGSISAAIIKAVVTIKANPKHR